MTFSYDLASYLNREDSKWQERKSSGGVQASTRTWRGSSGLVKSRGFAETIDSRIETTCIACSPDPHPAEWFCSWRFSIPGGD
jgi:hypothetical protein